MDLTLAPNAACKPTVCHAAKDSHAYLHLRPGVSSRQTSACCHFRSFEPQKACCKIAPLKLIQCLLWEMRIRFLQQGHMLPERCLGGAHHYQSSVPSLHSDLGAQTIAQTHNFRSTREHTVIKENQNLHGDRTDSSFYQSCQLCGEHHCCHPYPTALFPGDYRGHAKRL